MKGLVLGASGFVGRRILAKLGPARGVGAFATRAVPGAVAFDAGRESLADLLHRLPRALGPDSLTHVFILYGAIDPARCARDWAGTAAINVDSVKAVAEACFARGLTPVFFSSDYVFSGERGFWEDDAITAPLTAYGRQKAMVEAWLRACAEPWLVVRLSKVVSARVEPKNMLSEWVGAVRQGLPIRCAFDQVLSPVSAQDAAGAAIRLAELGRTGVFNLAGPEAFTRLALLRLLLAHMAGAAGEGCGDPVPDVRPCRLSELPFAEPRPLDTSLNIDKLQRAVGWDFTPMSRLCRTLARSPRAPAGASF